MKYTKNESCLICSNSHLVKYLELGEQPLANSYHKGEVLDYYPLQMMVCTDCWHSQLSVSVDPPEMFEHYLYISDTTKTLTKYFEWATEYMLSTMKIPPQNVLEIACNSGILLEMFQQKGFSCVGVDPAKNIRPLSEKRNLDVFVDYWDTNFANQLEKDRGKFDLVIAFHVLPHVKDPNEFIRASKTILTDNGKIFLQTSQCDMFINNEFDVIYHEHSSYFTAKSIQTLAHNHNLFVDTIIKTNIHGKSFLFSLQKEFCDETQLNELITQEQNDGMYVPQKYYDFAEHANKIKSELQGTLEKIHERGYILVGYGAAAKGNTLLNYIKYPLDYIIDDNQMKQGYLTPGMNIPIVSIDLIKDFPNNICFIPLAWNFYNEIVERIKNVRNTNNDIFIRYFPNVVQERV